MNSAIAGAALASVAAGGLAYVFVYPMLSGEKRAEKRQKALVGSGPERRIDRIAAVNRRDQVAQSLKDLEARQKAQHKVTIETRLAQAGLAWTKKRFIIVSACIAVVLALLLLAVSGNLVVAAGGVLVGGLGVPRWFVGYLKARRIKHFLNELPNAIDVIVRGVKAGLPLGDCMRMISTEGQEPLKSEFKAIIDAQTMGITIGEAVAKLFERVPVAEANFFGIVIAIQQKSGGNLSEALGNLSRVLRDRRKMAGKIKAMSMEAKASAGIIACLPFTVGILTYLSSPSYIELLWTTQTGKIALVVSGMWMMTGVFVMKKMISFDF
ncbi:MAG TPA: type II secretion system F family protein [Beijerinckiaceae bacterium]|jgi:tight adherence protein B